MKITLDHNCIINLVNKTNIGLKLNSILAEDVYECFVVNIGASELREKGVRPDNYIRFEELLEFAGIEHLQRLNPMMILDVTFWDRSVFSDDAMIKLAKEIDDVLFGNAQKIDITEVGLDSSLGQKWMNRLCDVHSMWCHIFYRNDIFLTTDGNFMKKTKLPGLISLGAGNIYHPDSL